MAKTDGEFYAVRAQQELDMAALATDPSVKKLHLDMAAEYATLRERADGEVQNTRIGTSE